MPHLVPPTSAVQISYLAGERELAGLEGADTRWLEEAERDYETFVAGRQAVREGWGVPVTERWYVDGDDYQGTVVIRHALTDALREEGGHIGYHVVPAHRQRGHATAMLAAALQLARTLELAEVLLTTEVANIPSRRAIEANGGRLLDETGGTARYLIGG